MSTIWKEYIPVEGSKTEFIKCELYYSLGGYNYFSYKEEPRGYYLSVCPVERTERDGCVMESYTAFSGIKHLLVGVKRKSKKKEEEALLMVPGVIDSLLKTLEVKMGGVS